MRSGSDLSRASMIKLKHCIGYKEDQHMALFLIS